jgi:hypothetical protein
MRGKLRIAMAEQLHIPPRARFGDILCTVIRYVIPTVHRLDAVATVTVKPFTPNV